MTDNELIARWMGLQVYQSWEEVRAVPIDDLGLWAFPENLKYHEDWNQLMSVVQKINNTVGADNPCFVIHPTSSFICTGALKKVQFQNFVEIEGSMITATYKTALDFIKWYTNNQK